MATARTGPGTSARAHSRFYAPAGVKGSLHNRPGRGLLAVIANTGPKASLFRGG